MLPQSPGTSIRGLYAITPDALDFVELRAKLAAALGGGVRIVQYRRKRLSRPEALRESTELLELCRDHGAALIINDDPGLAAEIGADGVHVGRGDGSPEAARGVVGIRAMVGASAYDDYPRAQALARTGADYVAFGSFYASTVKPQAVRAGVELLSRARAEGLGCPVVAIGGITVDNAPQLIAAGADAIAVISALFDAADVGVRAAEFTQLFHA